MPSHKSEDYKITAVKYHLDNESSFVNTCKIFNCSERSLKRWIEKYKTQHNITRNNRSHVSYKITQEQVKVLNLRIHYLRTHAGAVHHFLHFKKQ